MIVPLTIEGVWFTLNSDRSQSLNLLYATQINPQPQTPGEIRMYGNGRYNRLGAGATQKQVALAFAAVTPDEVATLRAWDGLLLLYRDDSGERFFGSYQSPQITRHPYDDESDVSLTFLQQTYSEAV